MSKPTENPIAAVPTPDESQAVVVKENLVKRGINFVKSHKKAALAVAGLVVLVGASAALGGASKIDDYALLSDEEEAKLIEELENADTVTE